MNKLSNERRAQMLACLVEGSSLRATSRITGVAINTVLKFVADVGRVCEDYQSRTFWRLPCKRIQCDEIWSFIGSKERNTALGKKEHGWGDVWTWVAIDADTKLVPCWMMGTRSSNAARPFMVDLAARMAGRIQITSDGLNAYAGAVDEAFGNAVDFGQVVKIYETQPATDGRYSPPICVEARKTILTGAPSPKHISTSYVERQNLTMRMHMRRFTRLTNGHSKKLENHHHAIALHFMQYNFCKVHSSIGRTPAMACGIADRVWSLYDIAELLDVAEQMAA